MQSGQASEQVYAGRSLISAVERQDGHQMRMLEGGGWPNTCLDRHKVVPVYATKGYRGSGGTTPFILSLGNRWRCVGNVRPAQSSALPAHDEVLRSALVTVTVAQP